MILRQIATLGPLGHLKPAPGTWASAAAVLAGWAIDRALGAPGLLVATLAATLLGFVALRGSLAPGEDPSEVVIDELAGQWLALLLPAAAFWARGWDTWLPWPAPVGAFLCFRLFDIWKPWIVGRADARGDADGVMLDDLWAGLFAGIAVIGAGVLWHVALLW